MKPARLVSSPKCDETSTVAGARGNLAVRAHSTATFIRASGFQSTDDPVCRNTDTLEAVVMTETGLAFAEAAPLFPLVRKIDDLRHSQSPSSQWSGKLSMEVI